MAGSCEESKEISLQNVETHLLITQKSDIYTKPRLLRKDFSIAPSVTIILNSLFSSEKPFNLFLIDTE